MICCVTGHRPSGFSFPRICTNPLYMDYFMKLSHEIEMLIWMGYDTFLSGMADGADLDFADMVYAIWNREEHGGTWNTIQYARSKEKPIRYLMLNQLNDDGLL